jgi:hypothetical protein
MQSASSWPSSGTRQGLCGRHRIRTTGGRLAVSVLDKAADVCRASGDNWVLALVLRHRAIGALWQEDADAAVRR